MAPFGETRVPPAQPGAPCRTIAVWGPTGAPGRTTLAVGLAGTPASGVSRRLIVDCDMARGKVACHLGALPGGALVTACRLPPESGQPIAAGHLQRPHRDGPWLLPGLVTPDQWPAIEPAALGRLLADLRAHFGLIVLDLGAALPLDAGAGRPPDGRGAVHQMALLAADLILAVCKASRAGLEDFALQFPRLLMTLPPERRASVGVVLNQVAPEDLPRYQRELGRTPGVTLLAGVPQDGASVRRAEESRRPLSVAAPRSPAAVVLDRLAVTLLADANTGLVGGVRR